MHDVIIDITTESTFRYKEILMMPQSVIVDIWQQVTTPLEHRNKLRVRAKKKTQSYANIMKQAGF